MFLYRTVVDARVYQGENDLMGVIPLSAPNYSDDRQESTSMNQLPAPLESFH